MKKIILSLLFAAILLVGLATVTSATTKQITITVKDTDGSYLSGIAVSMRSNYSLSDQIEYQTNAQGKVTFTMYSGKEYGFNVYDTNHNRACAYSPSTYTVSTSLTELIFTIDKPSTTFVTDSNPLSLSSSIYLSSYYGYRYLPAEGLNLHKGLDIAAPSGQDIVSVAYSTYYTSGSDQLRGNWVLYYINSSRCVLYQHLKENSITGVIDGEKGVAVIGKVGDTGEAYGYHLHIEYWNNTNTSTHTTYDPFFYIYK